MAGGWVVWTADLNCNVAKIDEQHRELFRQFNELGEAVWDGKGKDAVGSLLSFLAEYTVKHFRDEETLMVTHRYPSYTTHKKAHDNFVTEVDTFINSYQAQEYSSALVVSVLNKLGDWTRDHIRRMDRDMGAYVKKTTE
jgi:hemerythrin